MNRVTYNISTWFGGRQRVDLLVDGRSVEKAYFVDYAEALAWGEDKVAEKRQEVRS